MGVSAAYGPIFLWLQHPSAQQYRVTRILCSSPCRTTRREQNRDWGAVDPLLHGQHKLCEGCSPGRCWSSCWGRCQSRGVCLGTGMLLNTFPVPRAKQYAQPHFSLCIRGN